MTTLIAAMPPLLVVKQEYLKLVSKVTGISRRSLRNCAAQIIGVLEHWQKMKLERGTPAEKCWVFMNIMPSARALLDEEPSENEEFEKAYSFYTELMQQFGRNTLINALNLLIGLGWVERESNPWNRQDRTYRYRLNSKALKAALDANVYKQTSEVCEPTSEVCEPTSEVQKGSNITTDSYSDSYSNSSPLDPEAEAEVQADEEKEGGQESNLDTPATAEGKNESPDRVGDTAKDQGSAAPKKSIFERFKIKPPRPKRVAIAGFTAWYNQGIRKGLVRNSEERDGLQWVRMRGGQWVLWSEVKDCTWAELAQRYPCAYDIEEPQQPVESEQPDPVALRAERLHMVKGAWWAGGKSRRAALEKCKEYGFLVDPDIGPIDPEQISFGESEPAIAPQAPTPVPKTRIMDVSDITALIQTHKRRLGWELARLNQFVQEKLGRRSTQHLSDEQLGDLLEMLEVLP